MTAEEAVRLHRRARAVATKLGFVQERDDIAQEVICRMLEGRHQKSSVYQCVVDYIRRHYGDSRKGSHKLRQALTFAGELPEDLAQPDHRPDLDHLLTPALKGICLEISRLHFSENLDDIEIGAKFQLGPDRVSEILEESFRQLCAYWGKPKGLTASAHTTRWQRNNREKYNAYHRAWYAKNKRKKRKGEV